MQIERNDLVSVFSTTPHRVTQIHSSSILYFFCGKLPYPRQCLLKRAESDFHNSRVTWCWKTSGGHMVLGRPGRQEAGEATLQALKGRAPPKVSGRRKNSFLKRFIGSSVFHWTLDILRICCVFNCPQRTQNCRKGLLLSNWSYSTHFKWFQVGQSAKGAQCPLNWSHKFCGFFFLFLDILLMSQLYVIIKNDIMECWN